MSYQQQHRFHIPVMGLAFTIDSPVKVARFGISSVISIMEDRLIEMMRDYYYPWINKAYFPITIHEEDYRARRITDYLNLVNRIVQEQVEKLKNAAFEAGSEIVQYFEMLPDDNPLRQLYVRMTKADSVPEKEIIGSFLRTQIVPGTIDVNVMTKVDRDEPGQRGKLREDSSDAVAALRGFVNSDLSNSSVILSAGLNPRLYNYLEKCDAFRNTRNGEFEKKVIVKVSDYRSALIQGKYLAKRGVWVSEFRIESGLNCGGHAFATDGYLMGPILEEFKNKRAELSQALFELYKEAVKQKFGMDTVFAPSLKISVQGGIGTAEEDRFLRKRYGVDSTGWGTPFLLVPEATTVDEETLQRLCRARSEDVILSDNSPLGVRFYYLKGTTAEQEKQQRVERGRPGSPCTEKFLAFNTEFTLEPVCTASRQYQKLKLLRLKKLGLPEREYAAKALKVTEKECLCVGLSNAAAIRYKKTFSGKRKGVTICPGPNIAWFNREVSLSAMIDHIYGRKNIITEKGRPHMFIAELNLYLNYFGGMIEEDFDEIQRGKRNLRLQAFADNLLKGIRYYRDLSIEPGELNNFNSGALDMAEKRLNALLSKI